jgi:hypothetical protein
MVLAAAERKLGARVIESRPRGSSRLRGRLSRCRIDPTTCHHDCPRGAMTCRAVGALPTPPKNHQRVAKVRSSRGEKDEATTRAYGKTKAKSIAAVNRNGINGGFTNVRRKDDRKASDYWSDHPTEIVKRPKSASR